MKIQHRITFGCESKVEDTLDALGIRYERTPLFERYLIHIDISESHPYWQEIAILIKEKNAVDIYHTLFSQQEILQAKWSYLELFYHQGYPQPEDTWEWKTLVYEDYCLKCGIGYRQKGPFHLSKEPRLGKKDLFSLHWTHTVFCTPKVLDKLQLAGIQGYEVWPAILHRTGESATEVSQLVFSGVAHPGLADSDKISPETCPVCGLTKYGFCKRGQLHIHRESLLPDTDIQLTHEWFGSGAYGGFREILVSNRLAKLILDEKWRDVALKPIKLI